MNMAVDIFFVLKPRSLCEQTPLSFFVESAQHYSGKLFSKSIGTLVPKVSLSSFSYIKQLYLSRETSKTTTRKATREKKTSDADGSVSD